MKAPSIQQRMRVPNVRKLTEAEIEAFPGDGSVNVAIRSSSNGIEYYGDAWVDYHNGDVVAQFITDEDGDYIPIASATDGLEGGYD